MCQKAIEDFHDGMRVIYRQAGGIRFGVQTTEKRTLVFTRPAKLTPTA